MMGETAVDDGVPQMQEQVRGMITGWMPTVPRGELMAYQFFLRRAGPHSVFIGDCKHVVDAASFGVPEQWASSKNVNADLWRETLTLQRDHETLPRAVKIKAHRSRSAAAADGGDGGGVSRWQGNKAADHHAKSLARQACEQLGQRKQQEIHYNETSTMLKHLAVSAAWQLKHGAAANVIKRKNRTRMMTEANAVNGQQHVIRPRVDGGWECSVCKGFAVSKQGLRNLHRKECRDVETSQVHPSHTMSRLHGILWCMRCGCYTSRWPRELRVPCRGKPASEAQQNVRASLEKGLPPTTAGYLNNAMNTSAGMSRSGEGGVGGASRRGQSAPVGLYLRLPGGPLARQPARHGDAGDVDPGVDDLRDDGADLRDAGAHRRRDEDAIDPSDGIGSEVACNMLPPSVRMERPRSSAGSSCVGASMGENSLQQGTGFSNGAHGNVRRRIRGKSTPPTASAMQEIPIKSLCKPTSTAG